MNMSRKLASCLFAAAAAFVARADYSDACLEVTGAAPECRVLGNRRVYIFTDTSAAVSVTTKKALTLEETLVVGGGGGGGGGIGGGGGGGGVVHSNSPRTVSGGATFTVTVGAGGTSKSDHCVGGFGGHSILDWGDGSPIRAFGGGGGAGYGKSLSSAAVVDEVGSGGGIGQNKSTGAEGAQWKQGNKGASMREPLTGGGGGAGAAAAGEKGGEGLAFDITGDRVVYGSGGGGGSRKDVATAYAGLGGTNAGNGSTTTAGTAGVAGTGGGGGGGGYSPGKYAGGEGGSGTVVLAFTEHDPAGVRFTVAPIVDQLFHDAAVTPSVTVRDADGQEISSGFTVAYANNGAVGSARAIVSGAEGSAYEGYTAVMPFAIRRVGYSDDYVETTDETVCMKIVNGQLTYVFTNTAEGVLFVPKTTLTLENRLLVGGGGGGGDTRGGGGGGGGVIRSSQPTLMTASSPYFVTVGAGGRYGVSLSSAYGCGRAGGASSLIGPDVAEKAFGGGGGAGYKVTSVDAGPFGSGGGQGGGGGARTSYTAGQGFSGAANTGELAGGGGGAAAAASGAHGGEGVVSKITGEEVVYGSGGGGANTTEAGEGGTNAGDGGINGGEDGVGGTGGGGGGGGANNKNGGSGGSGIVVLAFRVGDCRLGRFAIEPIADQRFLGVAVEPEIVVTNVAGEVLTRDVDYTLAIRNNAAPGTASVTATGVEGTIYENFTADSSFEIIGYLFMDDNIATDCNSVFTVTNGNLVSYAFREPVSGLSVLFKRKVTLDECAVVGGGGGGGNTIGGGGGGGEVAFTNLVCMEAGQSLLVTVGAGGAGAASNYGNGGAGSPSTLTIDGVELTALGGGGGSGYSKTLDSGTFASGGGSANSNYGTAGKQWTEGRGNHGGAGSDPYGGGGGGAGGPGVSGDKTKAISGDGGMGILTYVSGRKVVYGSGGGGGVRSGASIPGKGGPGAGDGSALEGLNGTSATGGGGGGGGFQNNGCKKGGNGGSGAVAFSVLVGEPRTQGRFGIAPIAAYAYLGKPVLPTVVTVTNLAGVVLREGIDYDLSFLDNDGAGLAHVIATGCTGTDYAGFSAVSSFEIYEPVYIDEYVCTRSMTPVRTNLNGHVVYLFRETASTDVQTLRDLTLRQYLVVGGGGRGGNTIGGGGGGGGVLKAKPKLRIDRGATMTVTVGAGGKDNLGGDSRYWTGLPGELSSVVGSGLNLIAYGGAGGAGYSKDLPSGKYGSGGGSTAGRSAGSEGSQWTPGQGNGGGSSTDNIGGGGGGAFAAASGANGGEGVVSKITGEEVVYGSGGGGARAKPSTFPARAARTRATAARRASAGMASTAREPAVAAVSRT